MSTLLTPHQTEQLTLLKRANARDKETGANVYEHPLHPGSLAKLQARGLTDSAVTRKAGSQRTLYWITRDGLRLLQAELSKPKRNAR